MHACMQQYTACTQNPLDADVGTIRGDFCSSGSRNLVHASDAAASAEREIKLWFSESEIVSWHRQAEDAYTGKNQ
jgi:nucleoside-diphosphate kinase